MSTRRTFRVVAFAVTMAAGTLGARTTWAADVTLAPCAGAPGCDDASRLLDAMRVVAQTGGTLSLTDGDPSTVDVYEIDRCLAPHFEGFDFQGTIQGEGRENTFVEAVRNPDGSGFEPCRVPLFGSRPLGNLLWLYEPSGDVTLADLTFQVRDPTPCDPYFLLLVQRPTTALIGLVLVAGMDAAVTIRDVAFSGNHDDPKDHTGIAGRNVGWGFLRFAGPGLDPPQGEVTITGSKFDEAGVGAEISEPKGTDGHMDPYIDDSTFADCSVSGLDLYWLEDDPVRISRSRFQRNDADIRLFGADSTVLCTDNRVDSTFIEEGCPVQ